MNTALRVLLKKREEDQAEMEENVLYNVNKLARPYLENLKRTGLNQKQEALLLILESNLEEITSDMSRRLAVEFLDLTPAELQVANLKAGPSNLGNSGLLQRIGSEGGNAPF